MIVPGCGPKPARLMIIGERPGDWEAKTGVPFHPRAAVGKELTRYLHQILRLDRDEVYLTNLVPEYLGEKEVTSEDVRKWESLLQSELDEVQPEFIMTLGRFATRWFLGNVNLEEVYALPHQWNGSVVVPTYLRLYDSDLQPLIWYSFEQCRRVMAGETEPFDRTRSKPSSFCYEEYTLPDVINFPDLPIATDTEGIPGNPWGLSVSRGHDSAYVIRKSNIAAAAKLAERHLILHNSLYDIAILRELGIEGFSFDDTMVMAFLLCLEPQGLKELAYRYRGIRRQSYMEVIGPASNDLARDWLETVAEWDYGPAPEELVFEGDHVRIRKPWSLNRRLDGILGVWDGEIFIIGPKDRQAFTDKKRKLEKMGVRVGKINDDHTGWVDCVVTKLAGKKLEPHTLEYRWEMKRRPAAEDIRQRWETLCEDMPEATDAVMDNVGTMPEANLDAVNLKTAIEYSAGDADDTYTIYPILKKRIEEMGLEEAYKLDISVIPMIDRMIHVGFKADGEYFQQLGAELAREMEKDLDEIEHLIGIRINPNSPLQVASLLFDRLKLPVQQYTETHQPSTADEVIEALRLLSDHPVLPLISDYRELSKMKGTYADKLWRWLGSDGRIHPRLRITRVPSGRLACSEPNLMAIPIRSQRILGGQRLGKRIRDGFIAKPGCVLGSWDLDQIEMRVLAHRSNDPTLTTVFLNGEDIHQKTASLVFSLPMEQVIKGSWQRDSAKSVGFGIVYGISAQGLQLQLKLRGINRTEEECQDMIDAYLVRAYPKVRSLMEDKKAEARRYGYVRSMLGRIRYLPGIHSSNNKLRSEAERVSLNHDIQTSAQEIEKLGMAGIWQRVLPALWSEGWYCEPILQVHDELLIECDEKVAPVVDVMIRNELEEAVKLVVPIGAKGTIARTWGALK